MISHAMSGFRTLLAVVVVGMLFGGVLRAEHVPGEILVKFRPGTSAAEMARIHRRHGATVRGVLRRLKVRRLRIPKGKTVEEMVAAYQRNPNVLYAEPNRIRRAQMTPDDYAWSAQWHLRAINMPAAWDIQPGGSADVVVAVVDTGVAYEDLTEEVQIGRSGKTRTEQTYWQAPDLAQTNFVAGRDFVNNDAHPNDDEGHGTHVTGTIAQSTNNEIGVAGIAFNTSIMPVKVLDANGSGNDAVVADGITWAADNGADIINLSLGGAGTSQTLENACLHAYDKGVTIICASGNAGSTDPFYPAAYECCIAVSATQ